MYDRKDSVIFESCIGYPIAFINRIQDYYFRRLLFGTLENRKKYEKFYNEELEKKRDIWITI